MIVGSDGVRGRIELPVSRRHGVGCCAGPVSPDRELAVSTAPAPRLPESGGRSAGRWLPGDAVAHRGRHRRRVRARSDGRRPEAVLPSGTSYRLHLRRDRRGAGSARRDDRARVLLRHRVARSPHRDACAGRLRVVSGARPDRDDRRSGARQHQRRARAASNQGHSPAARQFRRVVALDQSPWCRCAAQRVAARGGGCARLRASATVQVWKAEWRCPC